MSGTAVDALYTPAENNFDCYCPGTLIDTPEGKIPVEALREGEKLLTLHGGEQEIRWIGRRAYDGRFIAGNHLALPISFAPHSIADGMPARQLNVSPGHGMWVDGHLIPAWRLVNGHSITQAESVESVAYFHLELATHELILAESCPAESFFDTGFRNQFSNAADFRTGAQGAPLPRTEHGFALENIRARLAARAGLAPENFPPGKLRGYIDMPGPAEAAGWAQDADSPESPVALDVFLDGTRLMRILANEYRPDLRDAGMGSGCHAFCIKLPRPGLLKIRRAADGAALPLTDSLLTSYQA